jgi:8-oxo-dGTP pyrophosphatase MutT (NUDIX family)
MYSEVDLNLQTRVIDNNSKNNKYSHDEKIKYLEDAIKAGGYYGEDGTWNSIVVFSGDNHIYRVRVETLIIKNDNYIFLKFLSKKNDKDKRRYLVPGGSISKDVSNIDQAINECKEEARIVVKNIQATGITYKELTTPPKWAVSSQAVNWNGNFTEVYVADYDKKYNGHIEKVDEDKFMITGKFYDLNKIFPYLRKEHKDALKLIYPNRFSNIVKENALTTKERKKLDSSKFGIPSLRKFPLHDKDHVIQAIRFFNTVDKKYEKELAENIIKAMKHYGIKFSVIGERNRLQSYL